MDWKGGGRLFGIERRPILRSFDGKGVKGKRGPAIFFLGEKKRHRWMQRNLTHQVLFFSLGLRR